MQKFPNPFKVKAHWIIKATQWKANQAETMSTAGRWHQINIAWQIWVYSTTKMNTYNSWLKDSKQKFENTNQEWYLDRSSQQSFFFLQRNIINKTEKAWHGIFGGRCWDMRQPHGPMLSLWSQVEAKALRWGSPQPGGSQGRKQSCTKCPWLWCGVMQVILLPNIVNPI